jgi:periplasmic protein TonB
VTTQSSPPRTSFASAREDASEAFEPDRPRLAHGFGAARGIAVPLPPALSARTFTVAWVIAIAAHVVLVALIVGVGSLAVREEEPLVRLVFVEPPPPPAAPLGAPNGAGTAPVAEPVAPAPEPAPVVEKPVPQPPEVDRLRHAETVDEPKPKPVVKPKPVPPKPKPRVAEKKPAPAPAEAVPVEPAPGIAQGSVDGAAGGVQGGVAGGLPGGVVGGTGTGPVPVSQVAHAPVLVRRVEPVYNEVARRRRVEGLVMLEAILDREGNVEPGIKVLQSIPMLDREALAAVEKWRFRPARGRDGVPVRVILEIPIRFVLR